jgi:CRP/FNR family transcriptional regulator, dissimilatory nitrate respiration regulator
VKGGCELKNASAQGRYSVEHRKDENENQMTPTLLAEFKQAAIANTLRQCSLFEGISGHDLAAIVSISVTKSLVRGEYLFLENAPVDGFYVVQSGAIKLYRLNLKGHEQVFHVFRPVESFGEEMIVSEAGYPADATAAEDSQVLLVPKNEFLALLKTQRELAYRLLRSAGQRVCSLMGLVDDLTLKDATTRLANWLIHHCPNPESYQPHRIHLQMTKHLLALELGIASETLSRTLCKFRTQRLIDVQGRFVTLRCPVRLAEFVRQKLDLPVTSTSSSWSETANAA